MPLDATGLQHPQKAFAEEFKIIIKSKSAALRFSALKLQHRSALLQRIPDVMGAHNETSQISLKVKPTPANIKG